MHSSVLAVGGWLPPRLPGRCVLRERRGYTNCALRKPQPIWVKGVLLLRGQWEIHTSCDRHFLGPLQCTEAGPCGQSGTSVLERVGTRHTTRHDRVLTLPPKTRADPARGFRFRARDAYPSVAKVRHFKCLQSYWY